MSRKDFELLAGVLNEEMNRPFDPGDEMAKARHQASVSLVAYNLADKLRLTNPRFNADLFLHVAGVFG